MWASAAAFDDDVAVTSIQLVNAWLVESDHLCRICPVCGTLRRAKAQQAHADVVHTGGRDQSLRSTGAEFDDVGPGFAYLGAMGGGIR
ncbi:hypothetical protein DY240_10925 [Jiangella rhizosphaerae]|uniref:Uncharacterized protein n=1 Tax=Jiangella rhizosphaerae TaxID=2293569 RepID=A0A418KSC5_9ACTN|nr:hypothetical protein DY240_10925 [Jiangella rhizosphaerae]